MVIARRVFFGSIAEAFGNRGERTIKRYHEINNGKNNKKEATNNGESNEFLFSRSRNLGMATGILLRKILVAIP